MIGQLKIVEVREKAKKALGANFLCARSTMVFDTGTVPLDLLERQVDAYIRANGGKAVTVGTRLGQHFLARQSFWNRSPRRLVPKDTEHGGRDRPGRGALTTHLLARAARVIAIEIDPSWSTICAPSFATSRASPCSKRTF